MSMSAIVISLLTHDLGNFRRSFFRPKPIEEIIFTYKTSVMIAKPMNWAMKSKSK